MEDYELFLDHASSPHNVGVIDEADGVGAGVNPICGDTLRLMLRIDDGRVVDAKFQAQGCAAAVAAASAATELIIGQPLAEVAALSHEGIVEALGSLPPGKIHGPALALDCLRKALEDFHQRRQGRRAGYAREPGQPSRPDT
ncbi:MAG TPA: iron-sulfur cluster assembly scaffold protein [Dehalococcoidia bacterium]|nr:iron-sulfur cluster assembly scaffold protein [Dehalococcoidia bacterium]